MSPQPMSAFGCLAIAAQSRKGRRRSPACPRGHSTEPIRSPRSTTSARAVLPGGAIVLSGITAEACDAVYRVFEIRFRMDWSAEEEGWCCALLRTEV